jgi:hypothetical protein
MVVAVPVVAAAFVPRTVATLAKGGPPAAVRCARATTVTSPDAPGASVPTVQCTTCPVTVAVGDALTKTSDAGSVSVISTPCAVATVATFA